MEELTQRDDRFADDSVGTFVQGVVVVGVSDADVQGDVQGCQVFDSAGHALEEALAQPDCVAEDFYFCYAFFGWESVDVSAGLVAERAAGHGEVGEGHEKRGLAIRGVRWMGHGSSFVITRAAEAGDVVVGVLFEDDVVDLPTQFSRYAEEAGLWRRRWCR